MAAINISVSKVVKVKQVFFLFILIGVSTNRPGKAWGEKSYILSRDQISDAFITAVSSPMTLYPALGAILILRKSSF